MQKKIINEREQRIQILTSQLDTRERELSEIYRSKAWHFIQMVRRTRQRIFG